MLRALTFGRKTKQTEEGKIEELTPDFGKVRSYYISDLEEQAGNYRVDDTKLEQDEVMAFGLPLWYCERKLAGHKTKVFNLNILADKPEQIISTPKDKTVKDKSFNITERII